MKFFRFNVLMAMAMMFFVFPVKGMDVTTIPQRMNDCFTDLQVSVDARDFDKVLAMSSNAIDDAYKNYYFDDKKVAFTFIIDKVATEVINPCCAQADLIPQLREFTTRLAACFKAKEFGITSEYVEIKELVDGGIAKIMATLGASIVDGTVIAHDMAGYDDSSESKILDMLEGFSWIRFGKGFAATVVFGIVASAIYGNYICQ